MLAIARLNERIQPLHRAERYEEPLDQVLAERELGRVVGGGSALSDLGEVESAEIEIELTSWSEEVRELLVKVLEFLGAPRGSVLAVEGEEHGFGRTEGLGVYLNGTDLPDEVYATCDVNVVYDRLEELLEDEGGIHSYWEGPAETALYLYGSSAEEMLRRIRGFVDEYPLCRGARLVELT